MVWLVAGGLPKTVAWLGAQCAISKDTTEDYNKWVPQRKEMWLLRIQDRIRGNRYTSEEAFRRDITQIVANTISYNSPSHGKYGNRGAFFDIVEANASPLLKPMPAHC